MLILQNYIFTHNGTVTNKSAISVLWSLRFRTDSLSGQNQSHSQNIMHQLAFKHRIMDESKQ